MSRQPHSHRSHIGQIEETGLSKRAPISTIIADHCISSSITKLDHAAAATSMSNRATDQPRSRHESAICVDERQSRFCAAATSRTATSTRTTLDECRLIATRPLVIGVARGTRGDERVDDRQLSRSPRSAYLKPSVVRRSAHTRLAATRRVSSSPRSQ